MLKSTDKNFANIINNIPNFSAKWDWDTDDISIQYRGVELPTLTNETFIISRQLGNTLPLLDMFNNDLEFMSAESVKGKQNEMFHENYLATVKATSQSTALVTVKYIDPPKKHSHLDTSMYLELIKGVVEGESSLTIVNEPYGPEDYDVTLGENRLRMRPNTFGSFYFEVELTGPTYGNILLQVRKIIQKIEN